MSVAFQPPAVGGNNAYLTFTDDAPDSPQIFHLYGTGVLPGLTAASDVYVAGQSSDGSAGWIAKFAAGSAGDASPSAYIAGRGRTLAKVLGGIALDSHGKYFGNRHTRGARVYLGVSERLGRRHWAITNDLGSEHVTGRPARNCLGQFRQRLDGQFRISLGSFEVCRGTGREHIACRDGEPWILQALEPRSMRRGSCTSRTVTPTRSLNIRR